MLAIQVQTVILILFSFVFTILSFTSHKKAEWNNAINDYNTALNNNSTNRNARALKKMMTSDLLLLKHAQDRLKQWNNTATGINTQSEDEKGQLNYTVNKMRMDILDKYTLDELGTFIGIDVTTKNRALLDDAVAVAEKNESDVEEEENNLLNAELERDKALNAYKEDPTPENLDALTNAREAVVNAQNELHPPPTAPGVWKTETNKLKPDGSQMQEKSVVLVIISILVLLLNMNGLLFSKEVGDPLQVVVGLMLVLFGVSVLVNFQKSPVPVNSSTLGTIAVYRRLTKLGANKPTTDNPNTPWGKLSQFNMTKGASIMGTISGILCAVLGIQVLVSSLTKKRPNFKSLKSSLKRKKSK